MSGIAEKQRKATAKRPLQKPKVQALPKKKVFPFLSLPPEIRNYIYSLALDDTQEKWLVSCTRHYRRGVRRATIHEYKYNFSADGNYYFYNGRLNHSSLDDDEDVDYDEPRRLCPALLALNRQLYNEAASLLYTNTFVVEDTVALHAFLLNIGPSKRNFIEKIIIKGYGRTKAHKVYNHPALSLLKGLPNLKEVVFDCAITWAFGHQTGQKGIVLIARQLYRDGFAWLHHVSGAKGRYDAALDIIRFGYEDKDDADTSGTSLFYGNQISNEQKREWFNEELRRLLR